jgi:hypothetical protein
MVGIMFMVTCVIFVATPEKALGSSSSSFEIGGDSEFVKAIGLGLLAPLFISVFISVSRYWTTKYGYKS